MPRNVRSAHVSDLLAAAVPQRRQPFRGVMKTSPTTTV
jgi:hypothetical protein